MTTLFESDGLVTVQCDVCLPPIVMAHSRAALRSYGWSLVADGAPLDVCVVCSRRLTVARQRPRRETMADRPVGVALPNLVIIGAAKAGTTSLHAYLDEHPDVQMSPIKEPQFFQDPDGDEWIGYYRSLFDASVQVRGEATPLYTRLPVPGTAQRMAALIPDAKLIYLVRDPVERAVSHYVEEREHGVEDRSVEEAFADPNNVYAYASSYAARLAEFRAEFPADQVLVVDLDDLQSDPTGTLNRIFGYLGVDPVASTVDTTPRNTRQSKREYSPLVRKLRATPLLKAVYAMPPERRERLLAPLRRLLSRPIERPTITPELRKRLEEQFKLDAKELRRVTGQPFAGWSV